MIRYGAKAGLLLLVLLAAAVVFLPWTGLLADPAEQPDGLVLRELPPLSRVDLLLLADGTVRYVNEFSREADGSVRYRRGSTWRTLQPERLAGPETGDWHRTRRLLLGTDGFGRDLASRLVHGGRVSLVVGLLGALVAVVVGAAVGLGAGLAGGWPDAVLMRTTDVAFTVPRLFLALLVVSLYGPSIITTILVLGLTTWMPAARLVRGEVLSLRERDYVRASRASGAGPLREALVHLLPGASIPLLVEAMLRVGDTILLESALSFLGLGIPAPAPSWGNIIADGKDRLLDSWWIATLPGLAIAATVIALNLAGDGLRRHLDPDRDDSVPGPSSVRRMARTGLASNPARRSGKATSS